MIYECSIRCTLGVVFPPSNPVTTRIISSLVGDSHLNLHLPLLNGRGHTKNIHMWYTVHTLTNEYLQNYFLHHTLPGYHEIAMASTDSSQAKMSVVSAWGGFVSWSVLIPK